MSAKPFQLLKLLCSHGLSQVDAIMCPSAIHLGLVLLDILIQICIIANLIKDVIDSPVVYLVLWCMLSDCLSIHHKRKLVLLLGQV